MMLNRRLLQVSMCFVVFSLSILSQAQVRSQRIRISQQVSQTLIVSKVQPQYPEEARAKHIEGSVIMRAEISKQGSVESLKVLSGDPLLASAATEAVEKWKYKPFVLNGEPIAVETQVTVSFTLTDK